MTIAVMGASENVGRKVTDGVQRTAQTTTPTRLEDFLSSALAP